MEGQSTTAFSQQPDGSDCSYLQIAELQDPGVHSPGRTEVLLVLKI